MTIVGKEYAASGTDAKARGIAKHRAVYGVCGETPTPNQRRLIEKLERGFHGDWACPNPYHLMWVAESAGIELDEEELCPDGEWRKINVNG